MAESLFLFIGQSIRKLLAKKEDGKGIFKNIRQLMTKLLALKAP
jgi:hypothetical protein